MSLPLVLFCEEGLSLPFEGPVVRRSQRRHRRVVPLAVECCLARNGAILRIACMLTEAERRRRTCAKQSLGSPSERRQKCIGADTC